MAFAMRNVTLNGTTQVISAVTPVQQFIVHNPAGNGTITIGTSAMDATSYGIVVAAGTNSPSIGPFTAGSVNLNDVYIRGTDTNVVRVLYVPY